MAFKNIYICDCCGKTITNPYKAHMREFTFAPDIELGYVCSRHIINKTKIDICEECFDRFKKIINRTEIK